MGLNQLQFTGTFMLLHLLGTCLCTTTVKHYRLDSTATFMSDAFKTYSDMHATRCFAAYTANALCYYVSYDEIHAVCMLSSVTDGWKLFRLDPPGPDIGDYFTVGNYSIAISSQQVTKTVAESLCASSGFGRLVEIRSEAMFLTISDYLNNLPTDLKDLYGGIWIASERIGGVHIFPDGSPVPITAANDHHTCCRPCLWMSPAVSYKYCDRACAKLFRYMCERGF